MSDESEVWNVLTMKDGTVSLLKNVSADECRAIVQRVRGGDPWSQEAIHQKVLSSHQSQRGQQSMLQQAYAYVSPGWGVDRCDWWGSKGGELVIWPKPDDYDARLAEAFKVAALISSTNETVDRSRAQRAA